MTSITASAQPAVIIPSLNPDHNLEQLVSKLIQAGTVQIIIVDDDFLIQRNFVWRSRKPLKR